jgi:beta-lactamase regulating signal transducer with metallopeptidase domain
MDAIFLRLLNMSITACYVILAVILIRLMLRRAPRIFSYLLWAAVLFRLTFPVSFESVFSMVRISTQPVPEDIMFAASPQIQSGIAVIDHAVNSSLPAPVAVGASINPIQIWIFLGEILWLAGVALLLGYSVVTFVRLHRKLRYASHRDSNIYEIAGCGVPFVFGIWKPKIYLPVGISEAEGNYILKHEQTHIRRWDHVIKPFAFLVLCVHWFNPLVWIAFFLMSADMELSCDESVLKQLGGEIKKDYSSTLLSLSTGRRIIGGCPLAFGEDNIKGRIKNILNYKRPTFWVISIAVLIVAAACIGLISDPNDSDLQAADPQGGNRHSPSIYADGLTVEDYSEQYVRVKIAGFEHIKDVTGYQIIDSKITKLERLDRFENLLDYPVELWRIEYRLKPDVDISKVQLGTGMNVIDGWITEDSSSGKPLMLFTYENSVRRFLDVIQTGDGVNGNGNTVAGREALLREWFEGRELLRRETYGGKHIMVKFPMSTGETCQLLLSQPVTKGADGIWCVERWMDGNGLVHYDTPETDGTALNYYRQLQEWCDKGQNPQLLKPLNVALNYINNALGQTQVLPGQLELQYNATAKDFEETPVSRYIGFVSEFEEFSPGNFSFNVNPTEWIEVGKSGKPKKLSADLDHLPDGAFIDTPSEYPLSLQATDETRIYLIDPVNPKDGLNLKEITPAEFKDYLTMNVNSKPSLFRILTKDGYVQEMKEQYLPSEQLVSTTPPKGNDKI